MRQILRVFTALVWWSLFLGPIGVSIFPVTVDHYRYRLPDTIPALLVVGVLWLIVMRIGKLPRASKPPSPIWPIVLIPIVALLILIAFRPKQISDYGDYIALARHLVRNGISGIMTLDAWRPPGMAFLLSVPLLAHFRTNAAVYAVNLVCFAVSLWSLRRMLKGMVFSKVDSWVMYISAILVIPFFMMLAISENPAFALQMVALSVLPWNTYGLSKTSLRQFLIAGLCIGLAALFRPIVALELAVILGVTFYALRREHVQKAGVKMAACSAVLVLGAMLMVVPWTIRNYYVYHAVLPISYNGGEVFYAANSGNSFWEQGRFIREHYVELRDQFPDPIQRNSAGFKLGARRIMSHPAKFIISSPYRLGQIFGRSALWPASYLYFNSDSAVKPRATLKIAAFLLLCGNWGFLLLTRKCYRSVASAISDKQNTLLPHISLLVLILASMLFECAGRYTITFVPYMIAILIDARSRARTSGSAEIREVTDGVTKEPVAVS